MRGGGGVRRAGKGREGMTVIGVSAGRTEVGEAKERNRKREESRRKEGENHKYLSVR